MGSQLNDSIVRRRCVLLLDFENWNRAGRPVHVAGLRFLDGDGRDHHCCWIQPVRLDEFVFDRYVFGWRRHRQDRARRITRFETRVGLLVIVSRWRNFRWLWVRFDLPRNLFAVEQWTGRP